MNKNLKIILGIVGVFLAIIVIQDIYVGLSGGDSLFVPRQKTVDEIKDAAEYASYEDLMRDTAQYKGKIVHIDGQIDQVIEEYGGQSLIVKSSGGRIWVDYTGKRLLEGDLVDVYGEVKGVTTYKTLIGEQKTVPRIESLYVSWN